MRVLWKTDTSLHGGRRGGARENSRLASMERASPETFLAGNCLVRACGPCSVDLSDNPDLGASLFQGLGVMHIRLTPDITIHICPDDPAACCWREAHRWRADHLTSSAVFFSAYGVSFFPATGTVQALFSYIHCHLFTLSRATYASICRLADPQQSYESSTPTWRKEYDWQDLQGSRREKNSIFD